MDEMLQEFITFANENFGVNVTVSESDAPDSFEKIYGRSFLQETEQLMIPDQYSDERLEYNKYIAILKITQPGMMPIVLPSINTAKLDH